ncbi:MAG: hypothetical protein IH986_14470 [Planctomycetes bacterium]|nr:hypothetical protein [Planctomycetota bacterium]
MPKAPAGWKWYFLSHFQLMRRTDGDRQILGTFVAPIFLLGILSSPGT